MTEPTTGGTDSPSTAPTTDAPAPTTPVGIPDPGSALPTTVEDKPNPAAPGGDAPAPAGPGAVSEPAKPGENKPLDVTVAEKQVTLGASMSALGRHFRHSTLGPGKPMVLASVERPGVFIVVAGSSALAALPVVESRFAVATTDSEKAGAWAAIVARDLAANAHLNDYT